VGRGARRKLGKKRCEVHTADLAMENQCRKSLTKTGLLKNESRVDRKNEPQKRAFQLQLLDVLLRFTVAGFTALLCPYCTTFSGALSNRMSGTCYSMQVQSVKTKICG
jgi:hypothetical protein